MHPRMAARLLHLPAATITALIAHGHLDGVPVKRLPPARPQVYVCPHSTDIFQGMFISEREMARQIEGRKHLVGSDDLLPEHRLDLREKTEPIYRQEVLDFLGNYRTRLWPGTFCLPLDEVYGTNGQAAA